MFNIYRKTIYIPYTKEEESHCDLKLVELFSVVYVKRVFYIKLNFVYLCIINSIGQLQVRLGLIAPILMRHPKTNMYIVNFSMYIPECIREVEYMWQLGLRKFNLSPSYYFFVPTFRFHGI